MKKTMLFNYYLFIFLNNTTTPFGEESERRSGKPLVEKKGAEGSRVGDPKLTIAPMKWQNKGSKQNVG